MNSRQYTSWFNFRGGDQQKPVGQLSGGERNRVHLAKLLKSGGNVLLLDEPTNDLDVDTLRALEDALLDFAGCAVVITHDRWFLDRVATHILAFEGDSQVTWFEGDWGEYADWVKETRGPEALEPHRVKFKPLVRACSSPIRVATADARIVRSAERRSPFRPMTARGAAPIIPSTPLAEGIRDGQTSSRSQLPARPTCACCRADRRRP